MPLRLSQLGLSQWMGGLLGSLGIVVAGPAGMALAQSQPPALGPLLETISCPDPDPVVCQDLANEEPMAQVRSVSELSDVLPTDWAYQALVAIIERYEVMQGVAGGKFRGHQPLSRDEFAAAVNQALAVLRQQAQTAIEQVREDIDTLEQLQRTHKQATQQLQDRLDNLTRRTNTMETLLFSPTTRLNVQMVGALSNGSNAPGALVARVRLNLVTSFTGTDLLRTQLEAGNNGLDAVSRADNRRRNQGGGNAIGTRGALAAGGGVEFVEVPREFSLNKLYYTFQARPNLSLSVGPKLTPSDFIDFNRFANRRDHPSPDLNFSSSVFKSNPLIVQNRIERFGGAGIAFGWQPAKTLPLTVRGLYAAADAGDAQAAGLFRDRNQATIELEYTFRKDLVGRLQYTHAHIDGTVIHAGGINAEWTINRRFAVFGRLGFGSYNGFNSQLNRQLELSPKTWMLGMNVRNVLVPGSTIGVAIGQPFISPDLGNATQTNFEAYYSVLINDKLTFSPAFLIVGRPNNIRSNGTIWEWVLRMVYSF